MKNLPSDRFVLTTVPIVGGKWVAIFKTRKEAKGALARRNDREALSVRRIPGLIDECYRSGTLESIYGL